MSGAVYQVHPEDLFLGLLALPEIVALLHDALLTAESILFVKRRMRVNMRSIRDNQMATCASRMSAEEEKFQVIGRVSYPLSHLILSFQVTFS